MARSDGRIEPGQRLTTAISARAWNRAQQAADIVLGSNPSTSTEGGTSSSSPYTWVYAKNTTGTTAARWAVMTISGVEITPTATESDTATRQFQQMPVLSLVASTTDGEKCVSIEPIAAGAIGRVAVAGAVQVKAADVDKLRGAVTLWGNADWKLVRLGGGGGEPRLGTISATWGKGDEATVTQIKADGTVLSPTVTFTATNWFATVTTDGGTKKVLCVLVEGRWLLAAAECD